MEGYKPAEIFSFTDNKGNTQTLIDSDTLHDNKTGRRIRIMGFDGLETSSLIKNDDGEFETKHGEIGGNMNTEVVADVINKGGFNRIIYSGKQDDYGRDLASIQNDAGEDLSETLYKEGLAKLDTFTSEKNATLYREGEMYRRLFGDQRSLFQEQRDAYTDAIEQGRPEYKSLAIDESEYIPEIHAGVQFRDPNRTLENKPKGLLSGMGFAGGLGWDGIREGFWGYLDAIGQTTDIELIENIGEQGVMRARSAIADTPDLLLNYDEVDNLYNGFQYVLNNAAMSAPYMVTSFAAFAAAVPIALATGGGSLAVAGLTALPNSVIYAGQTWNEMEGDKGTSQFVVASISGVGQATLEYLGLRGLIAPVQVFSAQGKQKVIKALMNKGMTQQQAATTFAKATAKKQKEFLKEIGKQRIQPSDIANFSVGSLGTAAGKGLVREALTEVGQEGLQMASAAGFSEKEYTRDEVFNRLTNAAVAGGVLGTGLGSAGNVYAQSRNRLNKSIYRRADQERMNLFELYKIGRMQSGEGISTIDEGIERQAREQENTATNPAEQAAVTNVENESATQASIINNQKTDQQLVEETTNDPALIEYAQRGVADVVAQGGLVSKVVSGTESNIRSNDPAAADAYITAATKAQERAINERQARNKQQVLNKKKQNKVVEYNLASEQNKANTLAKDYITRKKGMRNTLSNIQGASDFLEVLAVGAGRLVRGAERSAIKAARAIANPKALEILARVGSVLGDVVHPGINFKEFQQTIIHKAKLFVDEKVIANLFGKSKMTYKNAVKISEDLIEFGTSRGYAVYKAFDMQSKLPSLNQVISDYQRSTPGTEEHTAYIEILNNLGFNTTDPVILSEEIDVYMDVVNKFGTNGTIDEATLMQFLPKSVKDREVSASNIELLRRNFLSADSIKRSYDYLYVKTKEEHVKENPAGPELIYNINMWWQNQGFDWRSVRKNPVLFKKLLVEELNYSEEAAQRIYDNIARRGEQTINSVDPTLSKENQGEDAPSYSLIDFRTTGVPFAFTKDADKLAQSDKLNRFRNKNLFESLNKTQVDSARYIANAKYFGQGGHKLHRLFRELEAEGDLTRDELSQFAFYVVSMINAANGNYNRIENPRLAALNSFATSWSILAGLPLSMPASLPEFAMIYFDVKDDEMFKNSTDQFIKQISTSFNKALDSEANKGRELVKAVGLDVNANTIADRLATGERDLAFARLHEAFFKGVGIQGITQLQRRIVSVIALDAIKNSFSILELAPTKLNQIDAEDKGIYGFNFDKFNELEMSAYRQLTSLGLDVDRMMLLMEDLDSMSRDSFLNITDGVNSNLSSMMATDLALEIDEAAARPATQREAALRKALRSKIPNIKGREAIELYVNNLSELESYIHDEMSNAIQRYVHERIQMPGHSNRPLVFQDPHFQLITQFNGFISTFTANIIPKLYDRGLRRGNIKVKYDTFALIIMLMALGGASQLLKDMIKFGQPSPYLDTSGYIQRAVYASGALGQYERVVDLIHPLYPQRDEGMEWLMNAALGEAGPTIRNVQTLGGGVGDLLAGEGERGFRNIFKTAPYIGPATGLRGALAEGVTGTNPFKDSSLPTGNDVRDFFMGKYT